MTDRDKIELPPLPEHENMTCYGSASMRDYAYTAVLADRARREKPPELVNPKVHSANLQLTARGNMKINPSVVNNVYACATITIRWYDDGRAWIDSERNRELAKRMRFYADSFVLDGPRNKDARDAADALDGGVR